MQEQYAPLYHTDPSAIAIPKDGVERLFKSDVDNLYYVRKSDGTYALFGNGGGGGESLQITLAIGNTTGGNDIIVSAGDVIGFLSGAFQGTLNVAVLTANRAFTLPNASGTIALISDITSSAWLLDGNTNGVLRYIGTDDAFAFPIYTNGTEKAVFLTTGEFGINIVAPTARLHVRGTNALAADYALRVEDSAGAAILLATNNASMSMGRFITPDDTYTLTAISKVGAGGFLRVLTSAAAEFIHINDNGDVRFHSVAHLGIGMPASSIIRVFISGQGATDATYSLATTNSAALVYGLLVDDTNSVGIGISTGAPVIDNSALLHLVSTEKGFLLMNMTEVQRDAIAAPAPGLHVYNTTSTTPDYYNGVAWIHLFGSSTAETPGEIAFFDANGQPTGEPYFRFDDPLALGGEGIVISSTDGAIYPYLLFHGNGTAIPDTSIIVFTDSTLTNTYQMYSAGSYINFASNALGGTEIIFTPEGYISLGTAPNNTAVLNLSQNAALNTAHINFDVAVAPGAPTDGDVWFDGANLSIRIAGVTRTFDVT